MHSSVSSCPQNLFFAPSWELSCPPLKCGCLHACSDLEGGSFLFPVCLLHCKVFQILIVRTKWLQILQFYLSFPDSPKVPGLPHFWEHLVLFLSLFFFTKCWLCEFVKLFVLAVLSTNSSPLRFRWINYLNRPSIQYGLLYYRCTRIPCNTVTHEFDFRFMLKQRGDDPVYPQSLDQLGPSYVLRA